MVPSGVSPLIWEAVPNVKRKPHGLLGILGCVCVLMIQACSDIQQNRYETEFERPPVIKADTLLEIVGKNPTSEEQILVIRVDDSKSPGFSDRVNLERVIPPGPFRIKTAVSGLKTPSGRLINSDRLTRLIVFTPDQESELIIQSSQFKHPKPLGHGAKGWDLGKPTSPVWPGFLPLTPASPMLSGKLLRAIDRGEKKQAADALSYDGIRGIETLKLPLQAGQWHITLWIRDPGEWEYLPHPLSIQIDAQGKRVYDHKVTPTQWLQNQYLRGAATEPQPLETSWSLFGQRPEHRISFTTTADDNGVELRFSGHQPEAGFVAAVLAEPDSLYPARFAVEAQRAQWWNDNWPIEAWPLFQRTITDPKLDGFWLEPQSDLSAAAAPDSWVTFDVWLHHRGMPGLAEVEFQPARLSHHSASQFSNPLASQTRHSAQLPTTLRWGQWQVRRTRLSSTLLRPDNDYLRSGPLPALDSHSQPRRLHLAVQIPRNAPAGDYTALLKVKVGQRTVEKPVNIKVLNVRLPQADRPVGVYLDRAPHLDWFKPTQTMAEHQIDCDVKYLRKLGITGISPPLPTPSHTEAQQTFVEQFQRLEDDGFMPPILAYTPFKRLLAQTGADATFEHISQIHDQLGARYLSTPAWVTADEPSNPGNPVSVEDIRRYRQQQPSHSILAGHLNHKTDQQYADAFDLVLINDGFGANHERVQQLQQAADVWLYNLANRENPANLRAAAGFFLWRVRADGFIQWHARMPTADPFDPTDGRESDVQFFYPSIEACSAASDLDVSLFQLVEGIQDLRWLLWLEYQAQRRTDAQSLLQELTRIIPDEWEMMKTETEAELTNWRGKIIQLALYYSDDTAR